MASNAVGVAAREHPLQFLHYLRRDVAFNTTGITTGVPFANYIPQGAQIVMVIVKITTVFNAASTNVLTVGTNSTSFNNLVASGDVDEATAGADVVWTGVELDTSAGALLPYVKFTESGTAADTGAATITIVYACDNDL